MVAHLFQNPHLPGRQPELCARWWLEAEIKYRSEAQPGANATWPTWLIRQSNRVDLRNLIPVLQLLEFNR